MTPCIVKGPNTIAQHGDLHLASKILRQCSVQMYILHNIALCCSIKPRTEIQASKWSYRLGTCTRGCDSSVMGCCFKSSLCTELLVPAGSLYTDIADGTLCFVLSN